MVYSLKVNYVFILRTYPPCVALDIDNVKILFVYPSQLHESVCRPPLPEAHTNMDPFP